MILAEGFSRFKRRIACPAWRSASAVTAHVLTIKALHNPASAALHRFGFGDVEAATKSQNFKLIF